MPFMNNIKELCLVPGKASGDIASFEAAAAPLVSCICTINPVQDLHGQDYPYPSGGGINKWDEEWELGIYNSSTGVPEPSTTQIRSKNAISVNGNTTYYFHKVANRGNCTVIQYDTNGTYIRGDAIATGAESGKAFTTESNTAKIRFYMGGGYGTTYTHDLSINYPSTDTNYHPYSNICPITGHDDVTITQKDGNNTVVDTTTITFPDTVYGASLDVGTGVLTIDRGMVKISDINWTGATSNPPIFRGLLSSIPNIQLPPNNSVPTTSITESFGAYAYSPASSSTIGKFAVSDGGSNRIVFIDNSVNTLEAFLQKYGDDILVYPLATPTTTQLTPEQLNTILGDNNFYHDGNGPIDITYIRRIN